MFDLYLNPDPDGKAKLHAESEASAPTKKKQKKKKKELLNHKHLLAEFLKANRLPAPRYGAVKCFPDTQRMMGYFAEAFEAQVTVDGQSYTSDKLATTRERAAQRAAFSALQAQTSVP